MAGIISNPNRQEMALTRWWGGFLSLFGGWLLIVARQIPEFLILTLFTWLAFGDGIKTLRGLADDFFFHCLEVFLPQFFQVPPTTMLSSVEMGRFAAGFLLRWSIFLSALLCFGQKFIDLLRF